MLRVRDVFRSFFWAVHKIEFDLFRDLFSSPVPLSRRGENKVNPVYFWPLRGL